VSATADVETLVLPHSGWVVQWCDGHWRDLPPERYTDEPADVAAPDGDWVRWTGQVRANGRGDRWSEPSWWLVIGELDPDAPPTVVLADGTEPELRYVGRVWVCEWVSAPQDATVTAGEDRYLLSFSRRPLYLPESLEP
jgi:hypothetical protein